MEGKQKVALTFALYQNGALVRRETVTQDIVKVGKDAKSHPVSYTHLTLPTNREV